MVIRFAVALVLALTDVACDDHPTLAPTLIAPPEVVPPLKVSPPLTLATEPIAVDAGEQDFRKQRIRIDTGKEPRDHLGLVRRPEQILHVDAGPPP